MARGRVVHVGPVVQSDPTLFVAANDDVNMGRLILKFPRVYYELVLALGLNLRHVGSQRARAGGLLDGTGQPHPSHSLHSSHPPECIIFMIHVNCLRPDLAMAAVARVDPYGRCISGTIGSWWDQAGWPSGAQPASENPCSGGCHVRLPVPRGEVIPGYEAVIIIEARLSGMPEPFWWHRPVGCCRRGVTPGSRPCLGRRPGDGEGTGGLLGDDLGVGGGISW